MEYKEFAKYYDLFYQKKDYKKETAFLMNFITKKDDVIDMGCGTGIHASLLIKNSINVEGLDLNNEMLNIAKQRLHTNLYLQNILEINLEKKYDVIISMFAVINHLKDLKELEVCLNNLKNILKDNGKIIIDLHNPQSSGEKTDTFGNITRIMKWNYNNKTKIEESDITFKINDTIYNDHHTFRIFTINEIKNICKKVNLKVKAIYENYNINKKGTSESKNLQFIITRL